MFEALAKTPAIDLGKISSMGADEAVGHLTDQLHAALGAVAELEQHAAANLEAMPDGPLKDLVRSILPDVGALRESLAADAPNELREIADHCRTHQAEAMSVLSQLKNIPEPRIPEAAKAPEKKPPQKVDLESLRKAREELLNRYLSGESEHGDESLLREIWQDWDV